MKQRLKTFCLPILFFSFCLAVVPGMAAASEAGQARACLLAVRDAIDGANIPVLSGDITMLPSNYTEVPEDKQKSMQKLLDALEEDDDVQNVYSNMAQ